MNIVRLATVDDMPQVWNLIKELALFEKEEHAVEITVEDLKRDGFGEHPKFTCFVAEVDATVQGIALVYPRYSTWKGTAIHLEDLIVNKAYRGKNLGTQLLNAVVQYGKNLAVKRISWEVLDWNKPAINFYENKGAKVLKDWDVVQLDENGIENYLKQI